MTVTKKQKTLYLDHHATTPLDPLVWDAMVPFFKEHFGNPASQTHAFGWRADLAVRKARQDVADLIHAHPHHVVFTSGATEANNLAILGTLESFSHPVHMITTAVEHKAVLEVAAEAERRGHSVTVLPVDTYGRVSTEAVKRAIKPQTRLISVIYANNEIGTINPIGKLGELAHQHNILFHTDAAQAAGRVPIDVEAMKIDLLSLSAHKMYGPKGVGALFVRKDKIQLRPLMFGGQQEDGLRPGTLNVPGLVGLGAACQQSGRVMREENQRLSLWRDEILHRVQAEIPEVQLNGHPTERLASNLSLSFACLGRRPGCDFMNMGLHGVAFSSGSACTSSTLSSTSHVLKALGVPPEIAKLTMRLGLGRFTTREDVDFVLKKLLQIRSYL